MQHEGQTKSIIQCAEVYSAEMGTGDAGGVSAVVFQAVLAGACEACSRARSIVAAPLFAFLSVGAVAISVPSDLLSTHSN